MKVVIRNEHGQDLRWTSPDGTPHFSDAPQKPNRHLRFQKCLPTGYSQSESNVARGLCSVNAWL